MKTSFAILTALATFAMATPTPEADTIARRVEMAKQSSCKECIDNCRDIGGIGAAACKTVICAIECVITDD